MEATTNTATSTAARLLGTSIFATIARLLAACPAIATNTATLIF